MITYINQLIHILHTYIHYILDYTYHYYVIISLSVRVAQVTNASELYRRNGRRLPAKLVLTFAGMVCRVVSATDCDGH